MGVYVAGSTCSNKSTDVILMTEDSITCDVNGEVGEAYEERSSFLRFEGTCSKSEPATKRKRLISLITSFFNLNVRFCRFVS